MKTNELVGFKSLYREVSEADEIWYIILINMLLNQTFKT